MTDTDIVILLIVLCVLLWAIMAALHWHTMQLKALQKQVERLLKVFPDRVEGSGVTMDEFASHDLEGQVANCICQVSRKF